MSIDQIDKCIEEIINIIEIEKGIIRNKRLVDICRKMGSVTGGEINPHFYSVSATSNQQSKDYKKVESSELFWETPPGWTREQAKSFGKKCRIDSASKRLLKFRGANTLKTGQVWM